MRTTPEHQKPAGVYALLESDFSPRDALLSLLCSLVDYRGEGPESVGYTWPVFDAMNEVLDTCQFAGIQPRFVLYQLLQAGALPDKPEDIALLLREIRNKALEHAAATIAMQSGLEPQNAATA